MVEGEYHIPFETGKQDLFAANMLDRSAIGRWMSDPEGMGKALAERYTRQDLFAQMTKDQLVDTALMLSKEAEEMPVWDPSEEKSDSRIWPNRTSLQSLKKDALVSYLGAVYQRANLFLLLQLDFQSFLHLPQIADQDQAPLISIVPEEAEEAASKEGRVDLFKEYGDLICNGFLVPKRLCRFSNMRFYGLFMPDEVRALLRGQGGELILERMLLDILDCYARAAAHLYGVVTMDDLPKIVGRYEARIAKDGVMNDAVAELDAMILAAKRDGNLDDLRNLTDRRKVISRMLMELSAEGMMGQVQMAKGKYEDYDLLPLELDGKKTIVLVGGELMDRVPDDDALSDTVFGLLDDQKGKSRYYPATYERFMGYADGLVNDDVPAAKHLARLAAWLEKKHREEIVGAIRKSMEDRTNAALRMKYTEVNDETIGIAANEIVADLYREIVYGTRDPIQSGMGLKTLEEKYDLLTRNMAEANEYLNLWNEVNSNSRMFSNNGNTPLELRAKMPPHQGPTKLIFGPGLQGTDIPGEIQRAIQSGKFHGQLTVDDAEVKRASVKIGRNDPCPCGSGKKYKHCCGKNKP